MNVFSLSWLKSLVGRVLPSSRKSVAIRPLDPIERARIRDTLERAVADLKLRYAVSGESDSLELLQRTVLDGSFVSVPEMEPLGIVWGDIICRVTGTDWVTAEWEGTRMLAVNVPHTTILAFPIAMLEKRRDRKEYVDFRLFLANTKAVFEEKKLNPEYAR